jgi:hypothetical protein
MARQKRKRKKPLGGPAVTPPSSEAVLGELEGLLSQLPADAGPMWGQVHKLLLKTQLEADEVAQIVMQRNVDALQQAMGKLRGEAQEVVEAAPEQTAAGADVPAETLKQAMRAFRKRLKLTRLDHESKITGNNPLTSGRKADFDAIMPPHEYPQEVWDQLVARGDLKPLGSGFYMLHDE